MKYPMSFKSETQSPGGIASLWNARANDFEAKLSIPPEFNGPGGGASPEDLFNLALSNCFLATFKVYAEMSKLTFESVSLNSDLVIDMDDNNKPVMKTLDVQVKITGASNPEKALFLAKKAASSGFILNSVKTECRFHYEVV